jgi:hypothetical protein
VFKKSQSEKKNLQMSGRIKLTVEVTALINHLAAWPNSDERDMRPQKQVAADAFVFAKNVFQTRRA